MRISERWLREWLNPSADTAELCRRYVMAGLEVEAAPALSESLSGIVVARIESIVPHPQADKLRVCTVNAGDGKTLQIVCGAANARAGMLAPLAQVGTKMPGGMEIKQAALRGVDSAGMLCSAKELGLAEKSDGLLELDGSAKPGTPFADYLKLDDQVMTFEFTPNRGDCLSIAGLAREAAAIFGLPFSPPEIPAAPVKSTRRQAVEIENLALCPGYAGRVIEDINPQARTPDWMREKLRRSGVRCIHPVVDITNHVMLELGQPMHAFDCAKLTGTVRVRTAKAGETLTLLNEQTLALTSELLIADDRAPLALAGVMGGAGSGVTAATQDVFLESACFAPAAVAGTGRRHKLHSDAIYRYERGVDPALQKRALERCTNLVLDICGGAAGPVTFAGREPDVVQVRLRHARLNQLLGHAVQAADAESLLKRVVTKLEAKGAGEWLATVPSWRYDLRIEADLIEEVARLQGYDRIPGKPYRADLTPANLPETQKTTRQAREHLIARGWHEAVTYSFVDPKIQSVLTNEAPIVLDNPIAETMSVMRTTLWSGLIPAWLHNAQRQQKRVRLFELGASYVRSGETIVETPRLAGIAAGPVLPEQWGTKVRDTDFFDIKADLQSMLPADVQFVKAGHGALHPGQTAQIICRGQAVGWLGVLHPRITQVLDLPQSPVVFELDWARVREAGLPHALPVSEFPNSRRDLALVLKEEVEASAVLDCARRAAGVHLSEAILFDVFRGGSLPKGFKSMALGLIFQDNSRTLADHEVEAAAQAVAADLQNKLGASLRT
ncbi:MAG: phenylalanine--tRNA ligase subunit beta [Pseudomonadota bacterium]